MSRRGPRFNEEQKLAIVKEGEKTGVETVCAKYGISDQSYRNWRYKVLGIRRRSPAPPQILRRLSLSRLPLRTASTTSRIASITS
jgi:transposase-like protein